MRATENTPLKIINLKYEPLQTDLEETRNDRGSRGHLLMRSKESTTSCSTAVFRAASIITIIIFAAVLLLSYVSIYPHIAPFPIMESAVQPFSIVDPESLGFIAINRPNASMPGRIFDQLSEKHIPLPTNSWCENFFLGDSNGGPTNRVYVLPYVIDTDNNDDTTQGLNIHPGHVQANDHSMMVNNDISVICRTYINDSVLFCCYYFNYFSIFYNLQ
jgi:hypothetical protein